MKICAIIPSHNHHQNLAPIIRQLRNAKLFVYIIDDGSSEPARASLAAHHNPEQNVIVFRQNANLGKGSAVTTGFHLAFADGFTHALQVDADGQHDLSGLSEFLALATKFPQALICGKPLYDSTMPTGRRIGRWITHIWVWIETLSFRITDSMCGFRIYPLAAIERLLAQEKVGLRMDFDTDIMVRLFWRGVAPIMHPVRVTYPPQNISNFKLLRDNWRITKMHTRLCLTLVTRLPKILAQRPPKLEDKKDWAKLSERGVYLGLKFFATLCRFVGTRGRRALLAPIVLYFYMTGNAQRKASQEFLTRALGRPPSWQENYRLYMNFGVRALDVFMAWTGKLSENMVKSTNPDALAKIVNSPRGAVLIVSHLGNTEVVRALLDKPTRERLTVLVHTRHAANYNRILNEESGEAATNILQVTEIGPETIIDLKQRVENGGWIVIAGDRTPVSSQAHTVFVPFFGKQAPFPQGPWILAALLECPVRLLFCHFEEGAYRLTLEPFAEKIVLPRAERGEALRECAVNYAKRLEHFASLAPYQWYNFYDFWSRA